MVGGNPTTSDFEDAVQMMAAVQADAQYLVTRNVQDYSGRRFTQIFADTVASLTQSHTDSSAQLAHER